MSELVCSTLADLRAQGAHLRDPVRFRFAEALARRLVTQPPAVQALLRERLAHALAALADPAPARAASSSTLPPPRLSPLGELNRAWAARPRASAEPADDWADLGSMDDDPHTLQSARRFGVVWEQIAAERQLAEAIQKAPENAGPLNSHRLMVRAMTRMQDLSPDYLRRFLGQMDTLLWLDQLQQPVGLKVSAKDGKGARRSGTRTRK